MPCATCGLTRGWISLVHGNIEMAKTYNEYSLPTFTATLFTAIYSWFYWFFYKKHVLLYKYLITVPIIVIGLAWYPIIIKNIKLYRHVGVFK